MAFFIVLNVREKELVGIPGKSGGKLSFPHPTVGHVLHAHPEGFRLQSLPGFVVQKEIDGFQLFPAGDNEIYAFDNKRNVFYLHPAFFMADPEDGTTGLVESQVPAIEKIRLAVRDLLPLEKPPTFFVDPKSPCVHLPIQN
jgi:hypothetical protein